MQSLTQTGSAVHDVSPSPADVISRLIQLLTRTRQRECYDTGSAVFVGRDLGHESVRARDIHSKVIHRDIA
jgi:hypothetical protein